MLNPPVSSPVTSDITAELVKRLRAQHTDSDPMKRIHVVQHSNWNEGQTTPEALAYTKANTDYVWIQDANRYLNLKGGNRTSRIRERLEGGLRLRSAAVAIGLLGYRELMYILGQSDLEIDGLRTRFLEEKTEETPE